MVSVPPLPSSAFTVTEYCDVDSWSWVTPAFVRIWPVDASISNEAASAPSRL